MLKNNKGITLISVVITIIILITILSSIIYSNNNASELKETMLLNNDIEELNKKVQLYYLKNKTLPIDESVYLDNEEDGLKYYKLKTSLLENLNLKNLEKIEDEETFTNNDQWYVINKETHLIYFVKYIDGEIKFQEGKYSEKYENIIGNIPSDIKLNFITPINTGKSDIELLETKVQELLQNNETIPIDSNISLEKNGTTYHKIETDKLDDLNLQKPVNDTQFYVINLDKLPDTLEIHFVVDGEIKEEINQDGEEKGEDKIEIKEGREYANYIGWNYSGTRTKNLVLQYDGQYNAIDEDGNPTTNTAATTWADLTKNGNDGEIGTGYLEYDVYVKDATTAFSGYKYTPHSQAFRQRVKYDDSGNVVAPTYEWENKGLTLSNNTFVAVTCGNSKTITTDNRKPIYTGEDSTVQEYEFKNILPTGDVSVAGDEKYTMEIVFNYTNDSVGNRGLIGSGRYSNYFSEDSWGSPLLNLTNGRKFEIVQDEYYKKFGYLPFIDDDGTNFNAENFSGQTNELKINNAGDGIISSYNNGSDLDTGAILTEGIHTATVVFDGEETKIYIDGEYINSSNSKPNIKNEVEFTVGATERVVEVDLYTDGSTVSTGRIAYSFTYEEFLNDTVYSVRIYDRALNDKEIKYNYNIDASRFISQ